jgi:hypothetical protein
VAAGRDAELAAIAAAVARVLGGTVAAGPPPYEGVHADVEALVGTP